MQANGLTNADQIQIGQELQLPMSTPIVTPGETLFPDSELVYGPAFADFDVAQRQPTIPAISMRTPRPC